MASVQRRIDGPQDHHEQRGGIVYRDTRTIGAQVREMLTTSVSAVGLIGIGGLTFAVPALTTILTPIALAYAGYVLTRPVTAPIRLPAYWKGRDRGNPVPHPKRPGVDIYGPATGETLLGFDETTMQQIWVSGLDQTTHMLLPGGTGAGKTQFIYSLLCNTLAQGGGFTIVDGKASNNLPFSIQAMARRWGREADVRVINMLVSNGDRKTNTWNPFSSVNAEGMAELLLTLFLPDENGNNGGKYFQDRADGLIRAMAQVLVWVRDNTGLTITSDTLRTAFSNIQYLHDLANKRRFWFFDVEKQTEDFITLPASFPKDLLPPIANYVRNTGGFSAGKELSQQDKVREQHNYVVGGFDKAFTQMGSTLGHIFRCGLPDIDFHDVLYNRRILVVLLPSLENHPKTNAALGQVVITALRYAMATALGASIEGDYEDLVVNRPSASRTPYPIVFDEIGYYGARGIDVMMAQGRELNLSIILSFQEIGSLRGTLGTDWTVPLLGNPKLKIFQNIEDAGPTREWVEQSGGMMNVSVLPGYDNSSPLGIYADQSRADIREVKRVSWSDVQNLGQGQAIILFKGRRIYARLFYAGIKPKGVNRVFPTLETRLTVRPDTDAAPPAGSAAAVAANIRSGRHLVTDADMMPLPSILGHFYERLDALAATTLAPAELASYLLQGIEAEKPAEAEAASTDPFAHLFHNLPAPMETTRRSQDAGGLTGHEELVRSLSAFDAALGADPAAAAQALHVATTPPA